MSTLPAPTEILRKPKAKFEGQNGYEGSLIDVVTPDNVQQALIHTRRLEYVLKYMSRPFPTMEEMMKDLEQEVTPESLTKELEDLEKEHIADLETMYAVQAEEYRQDALEKYYSKDDVMHPPPNDPNFAPDAAAADIEAFYSRTRSGHEFTAVWEDIYDTIRHSYLERSNKLIKKRQDLEREREKARKIKDAQFPLTVAEFRGKNKDVQLRVAKYLTTTEGARQEKIREEFGWAWRQTQPLMEEFRKNATFEADVRAVILTEKEVKGFRPFNRP